MPLKNVEFPEVWQKSRMSFISKIVRKRAISSRFLDPLGTRDLRYGASKNAAFSDFGHHLEFWLK